MRNLREENWTPRHTQMLKAVYQKKTDAEIAEEFGLVAATICQIRNTPLFKKKLEAMNNKALMAVVRRDIEINTNGAARKKLEQAQLGAALKVIRIMRRGKAEDRIQFEAAKDILDRTGLKAIEVIETRERSYTPEEVDRAKSTLKEVENIIMRLENKDSSFLLARHKTTEQPAEPSSSVTDKGSDAPTQEAQDTDPV